MTSINKKSQQKLTYEEFCEHFNKTNSEISAKDYKENIFKQLLEFENNYNISSDMFYRKYCEGLLPNRFDYLKWSHLYKAYKNL